MNRLQALVAYAELSPQLARHFSYQDDREVLAGALITGYFSSGAQERLLDQKQVNAEAFEYSRSLLGRTAEETVLQAEQYRPAARTQGELVQYVRYT